MIFRGHEQRGVIIGKDLNPVVATVFTYPQPSLTIPSDVGGINEFTKFLAVIAEGGSEFTIGFVHQNPMFMGISHKNGPIIINEDASGIAVLPGRGRPLLQRRAIRSQPLNPRAFVDHQDRVGLGINIHGPGVRESTWGQTVPSDDRSLVLGSGLMTRNQQHGQEHAEAATWQQPRHTSGGQQQRDDGQQDHPGTLVVECGKQ